MGTHAILENQGRIGGCMERQLPGCGWPIVRQVGMTRHVLLSGAGCAWALADMVASSARARM